MGSILEQIDYAVYKTLEAHPDFDISANFGGFFLYNYDSTYFTSKDGARKVIEEIPHKEFIYEIGRFAMECGALYEALLRDESPEGSFMNQGRLCYEFYKAVKARTIDSFGYLYTHLNLLVNLAKSFGYYRYMTDGVYENLISSYNINVHPSYNELYINFKSVNNLNVRHGNVNKCLEDVMSGKQIELAHSEYSLDGKMFSVSDIGRVRQNQEDSSLILHHPKNDEYKLIAVADGMGGLSSGGEVSNYTIRELANWFNNLDLEDLDYPDELVPILGTIITKINKEVYDKYNGKAGCTLVLALVANGETIVANIGDSRCYILVDNKLKQVTEDDSYVYKLFKAGVLESKDDIRFHPKRNMITRAIGLSGKIVVPSISHLTNYDLILLFSDGVTDFISDDQIKLCSDNSDPSRIASILVEHAKYAECKKVIKMDDNIEREFATEGGADNLTAVVYNRRG